MDYHGIKMKGQFKVEQASVASFSPEDEGKLRYFQGGPTNRSDLYFASSTRWNMLSSKDNNEIPQNSQILVYSNVAYTGYTLILTFNDDLVYITNKSVQAGGIAKPGSTWTQPNHSHTEVIHSHSLGTHVHTFSGATDVTTSSLRCDNDKHQFTEWRDHSHPFSFTTVASIGNTGNSSSQSTGAAATANTWRPKGRNFTLQKRA